MNNSVNDPKITFENLPQAVSQLYTKLESIESLLLQDKPEPDRWLSMNELIEYMPGNPAKATIYAKISDRQIPHKKVGKRLAFLKSEIDEWIHSQKRKTLKEIKADV